MTHSNGTSYAIKGLKVDSTQRLWMTVRTVHIRSSLLLDVDACVKLCRIPETSLWKTDSHSTGCAAHVQLVLLLPSICPSFLPPIHPFSPLVSFFFLFLLINQYSFFFGFKFIFIYISVLNMHSLLKNNLAVYSNHNDRHGRPVPPLPHRVHEWHEGSGVGHPHDESSLDIARRCVRCAAALMLLCCAVLCCAVRCYARSRISCHPSIESPIPKIVHCH